MNIRILLKITLNMSEKTLHMRLDQFIMIKKNLKAYTELPQ